MTSEGLSTKNSYQTRFNAAIESILREAKESMIRGEYTIALQLYDKVIKNDPNNKTALFNKGRTYEFIGNYPAAIKSYGELIEVDQYNPEAWYNRGLVLKKNGAFVEGMINIRMGIALSHHGQ